MLHRGNSKAYTNPHTPCNGRTGFDTGDERPGSAYRDYPRPPGASNELSSHSRPGSLNSALVLTSSSRASPRRAMTTRRTADDDTETYVLLVDAPNVATARERVRTLVWPEVGILMLTLLASARLGYGI